MNKSFRISSVLFFLICSLLFAASAQTEDADKLYAEGEYEKAADAFLAIAAGQGTSASLYYNLGNCYAQAGNLGNAILYYSRAFRLDPRNKEIKNNLNYFSSKVEDSNRAELRGKKISVAPDPETFFTTAHRVIAEDRSSNFWAVLSAGSFVLLIGLVALYLFCGNIMLRKTGFFGGIIMLVCSITFLVFAFMSADAFESHDQAVLMAYKTQLLIEPSSDAKPAANQLCQGTVFDIVAQESDVEGNPTWYKVRLNSNIEGWVKANAIEII